MTDTISIRPEDHPVLVASTGGHLEQLHKWAERWGVLGGKAHWVTFLNDQSASLLRGENVSYVDYVAPRDIRGTLRTSRPIRRAIELTGSRAVVSTGAAIGVSAAIAARSKGAAFTYIDSLARVDSLSLTARILRWFPGIDRYTQSPPLAGSNFAYAGSVLDDFEPVRTVPAADGTQLRVLVTVGTIRPYGFDRLIEHLDGILEGDDVTWQTGETRYSPSHGTSTRSMSRHELLEAMESSDVVISHAGVGSILSALSVGKIPIVVPRRQQFDEHIDDHQLDIARLLSEMDLVKQAEVDQVSRGLLYESTGWRARNQGADI